MADFKDWGDHFQTPDYICDYMASFLPKNAGVILEPTPGKGNLVKALLSKGVVIAPDSLEYIDKSNYDWVVMNPPFTPMKQGYDILYNCMELTENIVALMPYLAIINSEKRTDKIVDWGLVSITHLPRKVFNGSRVQTCILHMKKGFAGETIYKQLPL